MYYLYVDESGDTGLQGSLTNYFVLTGLVIHETKWRTFLNDLVAFRRNLRANYGLKMNEELHAKNMVQRGGSMLQNQPRHVKMYILKQCIDWLATRSDIHIVTVAVNKATKVAPHDVFESAWQTLIQRFENTIQHQNYPGGFAQRIGQTMTEQGMIIPDNTDNKKLTALLRKMRHFNAVPNTQQYAQGGAYRNLKLQYVIEDPFFKDSAKSYIHQMVDVVVYFARQKFEPNAQVKKLGARNFYDRLLPVINPHTTRGHSLHIKVL